MTRDQLRKRFFMARQQPPSCLSVYDLRLVERKTPDFQELEAVQQELKRRGIIPATSLEDLNGMTGGGVVGE
jgi:hypothetical protein